MYGRVWTVSPCPFKKWQDGWIMKILWFIRGKKSEHHRPKEGLHALAEPGGPWHLSFVHGWLENLFHTDFTGLEHWLSFNFPFEPSEASNHHVPYDQCSLSRQLNCFYILFLAISSFLSVNITQINEKCDSSCIQR